MSGARRDRAGEQYAFMRDSLAAMAAPDRGALDPSRHDFTFVRREFLREVRTMVFDVAARDGADVGISGRIWVEGRYFNIVRQDGVSRDVRRPCSREKVYLHMDGWRVNSGSGQWLPAYVYWQEAGLEGHQAQLMRSQARLWATARHRRMPRSSSPHNVELSKRSAVYAISAPASKAVPSGLPFFRKVNLLFHCRELERMRPSPRSFIHEA